MVLCVASGSIPHVEYSARDVLGCQMPRQGNGYLCCVCVEQSAVVITGVVQLGSEELGQELHACRSASGYNHNRQKGGRPARCRPHVPTESWGTI